MKKKKEEFMHALLWLFICILNCLFLCFLCYLRRVGWKIKHGGGVAVIHSDKLCAKTIKFSKYCLSQKARNAPR